MLIAGVGFCFQLWDTFKARNETAKFASVRLRISLVMSGIVLGVSLLVVRVHPVTLAINAAAISPLIWITYKSIMRSYRFAIWTGLGLFVGGIFVAYFSISSMGLLATHNGYPQPLLKITLLWFLTIPIALLLPREFLGGKDKLENEGHAKLYFWGASLMIVCGWIVFSQLVLGLD